MFDIGTMQLYEMGDRQLFDIGTMQLYEMGDRQCLTLELCNCMRWEIDSV